MKTIFFSPLFLFLSFLPWDAMAADSPDSLIREAGRAISQCLKGRKDLKLVVTGIRAFDDRANGLTAWLADSLTSELARNPELHLLERVRLKEITKENGLSLNDLFDESKAMELGKLLSAHIMVNGTLTRMGDRFDLNLRVVDCEKGEIIPGCGFRDRVKGSKDLMELWAQTAGLTVSVYPSALHATVTLGDRVLGETGPGRNVLSTRSVNPGVYDLKVVSPGYPLQRRTVAIEPLVHQSVMVRFIKPLSITFWQEDAASGDVIGNRGHVVSGRRYRFCFRTNRDCFVYVFNQGTSGRIFPLIPNERLRQGNRVLAHTETRIPEKGGFPIEGPAGTEKLFVLASLSPLSNLDRMARSFLENPSAGHAGLQKEVVRFRDKNLTKNYGLPDAPAVSKSVSLNPDDGVMMELMYVHE